MNENTKEIQAELLEILKKFDKVCKEDCIPYSLHGGTLLGAVREHGFIPWDDDVDITMMRCDYERLMQLIQADEACGLSVYNDFSIMLSLFDKEAENKNGSWIDVILYDYISGNKLLQKLKINILAVLAAFLKENQNVGIDKKDRYPLYKRLVRNVIIAMGKVAPFDKKYRIYQHVAEKWLVGNKKFIHRSTDQYCGLGLILPKTWMSEYEYIPFEDTEFMVSKNYHEILVSTYGDDYMTPKPPDILDANVHTQVREIYKNIHNGHESFNQKANNAN